MTELEMLKEWYRQEFHHKKNGYPNFNELSENEQNRFKNTFSFTFFKLDLAAEDLKKVFLDVWKKAVAKMHKTFFSS